MLHRGYEAWIADAHNQRFVEYATRIEDGGDAAPGRTVNCFIPSENGKRFIISWKDHGGGHHFSVRPYIDGVRIPGKICKPGDQRSRQTVRTTSADTYNALQFADLKTTDDDGAAMAVDSLGTIELRVYHVHPETRSKPFRPSTFAGVGSVHERSKKAGAHCVTLGGTVDDPNLGARARARGHRSCRLLNPEDGPFVTFVFRYRPAVLLQAEGIMPLPASEKGKGRAGPSAVPTGNVKAEPSGPSRSAASTSQLTASSDIIELTDDEDDVSVGWSEPRTRKGG
ncbi:hypothetical protein TRAPUB_8564 [Trametes pubescens]|uniref:DUF7918 domain-containing protein n=1 Tax=Trametes pubescens TaxID=154538 RepID=A0A1M2W500_TRAPU|nr:hypothetical protein TRAPUB_8564 [Trametes pubescens]